VSGNVHEATVERITSLARQVVEVRLRVDPPAPLMFRAGQFISLRVGRDADDNPILRSYSIASSSGSPELSLIVKILDGGVASDWFRQLTLGERVHFTGPMGFFVLDLSHRGDVVVGATGVGIAPVLPMLDELLLRHEGQVRLHWGNRDPEELFWLDELEARRRAHPRLQYHLYLSGAAPGWSGRRGRITRSLVDELDTLRAPTFYLVGNGAMIRDVKQELQARGVDRKRQIRNEAFFD
jgi:ferredoxin-NADP reductase